VKTDILAFGAHPDDVELSASGTLIKHINSGFKAVIADLTKGELGTRGNAQTRAEEAKAAAEIMGIQDRITLDLGDGFLNENKETLLEIIKVIRHYQPKVILANAIEDRHPDHGKAASLIQRSCFLSGLIKIETKFHSENQKPWRPTTLLHYIQDDFMTPNLVVDISQWFDTKMKAVLAYQTQFYQGENKDNLPSTPISSKDFADNLQAKALIMGRYIQVRYAEGFIYSRPPGVDNLMQLM
jgi:N-acetylglucosamine malate deacetylase 1